MSRDTSQYDSLGPYPARMRAAVMSALAAMTPKTFEEALYRRPSRLVGYLEQRDIRFDISEVKGLVEDLRRTWPTIARVRPWCADYLRCILANRIPSSELELCALVPLLRLAGTKALSGTGLTIVCEAEREREYRHGVSHVMRHVGRMTMDQERDAFSLLAVRCFLGTTELGVPGWCGELFEEAVALLRAAEESHTTTEPGLPDAPRQGEDHRTRVARVLKVLKSSEFLEDTLENWVDPIGPISACALGCWLRRYLELPSANHGPARELGGSNVLADLLLAIVAQRIVARASDVDTRPGGETCFTRWVEDLLLHIVAEVCYQEGQLPRELRIARHLRGSERAEVLLYMLHDYRDHLYHAIDVAGFGRLLDDAGFLGASRENSLQGKRLGEWYIASLFHDLGFGLKPEFDEPWSIAAKLPPFDGLRRNVQDSFRMLLRSLNQNAAKCLGLHTELGDRFDHGIISYHYVSGLLDSPGARRTKKGPTEALKAVAKHNLVEESVNYANEPVAALLVLCDELQDWGRPRWDYETLASELLNVLHSGRQWTLEPRKMCGAIRMSRCSPNASEGCRGTISILYSDPIEERYDPWGLVVKKLHALQRVSGLPAIRLVLSLPYSRRWYERVQSMGLASFRAVMRKFVVECDHPVLGHDVLWPNSSQRAAVRWLTHDEDAGIAVGEEQIRVDLNSVSTFRPVLIEPATFSSEFSAFMGRLLGQF